MFFTVEKGIMSELT